MWFISIIRQSLLTGFGKSLIFQLFWFWSFCHSYMSPWNYHPRSSTRGPKHWGNCLFATFVCKGRGRSKSRSKFQLPAMFWLVYFPSKIMGAERNIQWDCGRLSFLPSPSPLSPPPNLRKRATQVAVFSICFNFKHELITIFGKMDEGIFHKSLQFVPPEQQLTLCLNSDDVAGFVVLFAIRLIFLYLH